MKITLLRTWPKNVKQIFVIFTHLKLWVVVATYNFEWVKIKIYNTAGEGLNPTHHVSECDRQHTVGLVILHGTRVVQNVPAGTVPHVIVTRHQAPRLVLTGTKVHRLNS